jgi:hypothetical protein
MKSFRNIFAIFVLSVSVANAMQAVEYQNECKPSEASRDLATFGDVQFGGIARFDGFCVKRHQPSEEQAIHSSHPLANVDFDKTCQCFLDKQEPAATATPTTEENPEVWNQYAKWRDLDEKREAYLKAKKTAEVYMELNRFYGKPLPNNCQQFFYGKDNELPSVFRDKEKWACDGMDKRGKEAEHLAESLGYSNPKSLNEYSNSYKPLDWKWDSEETKSIMSKIETKAMEIIAAAKIEANKTAESLAKVIEKMAKANGPVHYGGNGQGLLGDNPYEKEDKNGLWNRVDTLLVHVLRNEDLATVFVNKFDQDGITADGTLFATLVKEDVHTQKFATDYCANLETTGKEFYCSDLSEKGSNLISGDMYLKYAPVVFHNRVENQSQEVKDHVSAQRLCDTVKNRLMKMGFSGFLNSSEIGFLDSAIDASGTPVLGAIDTSNLLSTITSATAPEAAAARAPASTDPQDPLGIVDSEVATTGGDPKGTSGDKSAENGNVTGLTLGGDDDDTTVSFEFDDSGDTSSNRRRITIRSSSRGTVTRSIASTPTTPSSSHIDGGSDSSFSGRLQERSTPRSLSDLPKEDTLASIFSDDVNQKIKESLIKDDPVPLKEFLFDESDDLSDAADADRTADIIDGTSEDFNRVVDQYDKLIDDTGAAIERNKNSNKPQSEKDAENARLLSIINELKQNVAELKAAKDNAATKVTRARDVSARTAIDGGVKKPTAGLGRPRTTRPAQKPVRTPAATPTTTTGASLKSTSSGNSSARKTTRAVSARQGSGETAAPYSITLTANTFDQYDETDWSTLHRYTNGQEVLVKRVVKGDDGISRVQIWTYLPVVEKVDGKDVVRYVRKDDDSSSDEDDLLADSRHPSSIYMKSLVTHAALVELLEETINGEEKEEVVTK